MIFWTAGGGLAHYALRSLSSRRCEMPDGAIRPRLVRPALLAVRSSIRSRHSAFGKDRLSAQRPNGAFSGGPRGSRPHSAAARKNDSILAYKTEEVRREFHHVRHSSSLDRRWSHAPLLGEF